MIQYHQYITEEYGYVDEVVNRLSLKLRDFLIAEYNRIFAPGGISLHDATLDDSVYGHYSVPYPVTPEDIGHHVSDLVLMKYIRREVLLGYLVGLLANANAEELVTVELKQLGQLGQETLLTKINALEVRLNMTILNRPYLNISVSADKDSLFSDMQYAVDNTPIHILHIYSKTGDDYNHDSYTDFTRYPQ